jgi:hypothetical protein
LVQFLKAVEQLGEREGSLFLSAVLSNNELNRRVYF